MEFLLQVLILTIIIYVAICLWKSYSGSVPLILGGMVLGGAPATVKQRDLIGMYDEYDDNKLLETENKEFLGQGVNQKDIVIDGHNLIHYMIGYKRSGTDSKQIKINGQSPNSEITIVRPKHAHFIKTQEYIDAVKGIVKMSKELFKGFNVFLVIKDPSMDIQQKEFDRLTGTTEAKFFGDLVKGSKVRIVVAKGGDKARDDFAAIYIAEQLGNSVLLTRDRFSDIDKTLRLTEIQYDIYGSDSQKYQDMLKFQAYPNIGRWSFKYKLIGYTAGGKGLEVYDKKTKTPLASNKVLMIPVKYLR